LIKRPLTDGLVEGKRSKGMGGDDSKDNADLILSDKTGALLMLNKEERKLIKELLVMTMHSDTIKDYLIKRLGSKYVDIGEKLLKAMGGPT